VTATTASREFTGQKRAACGHTAGCGCTHGAACCLDCPLATCVFEDKRTPAILAAHVRYQAIADLYRAGLPIDEIARRYGLARRTIFRAVQMAGRR
jgi:hypothetical protein